jgi:hypothetical protein
VNINQGINPQQMGLGDIFQGVPPEQRQAVLGQLVGLGGLNDKNAMLREQMAQAEQLMNAPRQRFSTWGGALAGGIGDIVSKIAGKGKLDKLTAEQEAIAKQIDAGRQKFGSLAFPEAPPVPQPMPGPSPGMGPNIPQYLRRPDPNDVQRFSPLMFGG